MDIDQTIKLNIGSHSKRIDGYQNVDILKLPDVDYVQDVTETWQWDSESVEEILMEEFLEHISFHQTNKVLSEAWRVLKVGGKLHIQVPDCGSMMEMYVKEEVCECVPHKPSKENPAVANPKCPNCGGFGKVNPRRWLLAFTGAQKYGIPDIHKNIFTKQLLEDALIDAGEWKIDFREDPLRWKIRVTATKI